MEVVSIILFCSNYKTNPLPLIEGIMTTTTIIMAMTRIIFFTLFCMTIPKNKCKKYFYTKNNLPKIFGLLFQHLIFPSHTRRSDK